tara:strand:+ start:78 stop:818 length:741 start_codon:yes stop_codon:yes gene_type:complete
MNEVRLESEKLNVSLITPTYNEKENVPILVEEIFSIVEGHSDIDIELIVVDDNSPDGTGEVAEKLSKNYPMHVIHRDGKLGLGSAVMEGFAHSTREYVGVIDADLSHDPIILPDLIRGLKKFDVTIGSRFGETSKVEKWAFHRRLTSLTGVGLARILTGVEDPLSGYFFLRRNCLGDLRLTSAGYKILLEILVKGSVENHYSIPFVFRNRQFSSSKLNLREYLLFAKQLLYFSSYKLLKKNKEQRK